MRILVALAVLVTGVFTSCSTPTEIERLTIVNGTPFDVEVRLSNAEKESWQGLGRADHRSSTVVDSVTDEGATWVFQFQYGGKLVDEMSVSRVQLERNGWRIEVPARIEQQMRRLGFRPPAGA